MAEAKVAVLVPNLFVRAGVDAAVQGAGAFPLPVASADAVRTAGVKVAILDLEALGATGAETVAFLAASGVTVLAFGPHVEAENLAAARRAGAIVLPRGSFLARLPELLARALAK